MMPAPELEISLIRCLFQNPDQIADTARLVRVDMLESNPCAHLLKILYDADAAGEPIRLLTIQRKVGLDGAKQLAAVGILLSAFTTDYVSLLELPGLVATIREKYLRREGIAAATTLLTALRSPETGLDELHRLSEKTSEVLLSKALESNSKTAEVVTIEALEAIEAAMTKKGGLTGVPTGLPRVNEITGGWQDSDIIMIAGRPGAGKTIAGLFHALAAAKAGTAAGFVSLEMPAKSLMNRLIAHETGIPYGRIKRGQLNAKELADVRDAAGNLSSLPLYFYDGTESRDIKPISAQIRNWVRRMRVELVIIDYVQLIEDSEVRSGKEYEVLTSVSKKLKKLQLALRIPFIELAQLSREIESRTDKTPRLSDLRSTGQFEQDASVVIGLFRPAYYALQEWREGGEVGPQPEDDHILDYVFLKNRDGETGVISLTCHVSLSRISNDNPLRPRSASNLRSNS